MSEYPEHDKLSAIRDQSQSIGQFLDWLLNEQGRYIASYDRRDEVLEADYRSIEDWLARYFDIDRDKLEEEKRDMLDKMRAANSER